MCGIAGAYFKDDTLAAHADAMLTTMLSKIDHRGGHACGFVTLGDAGVGQWQKAAVDAKEFNLYRQPVPEGTRVMLAHTRFATQGHEGFMENNHPIRRGPFYVIHNGHVFNDDKLFERSSRERYGQVDSEALAAHIAHIGSLERIGETLEAVLGDAAVGVIDEREPRKLAVARASGSPLYVLETRRMLLFASTAEAVLETHRRHIGRIKPNRVEEIKEGTLLVMNNGASRRYQFTVKEWAYTQPRVTFPSAWKSWESSGDTLLTGQNTKDSVDVSWGRCDVCDEDTLGTLNEFLDQDGISWLMCDNCYYAYAQEEKEKQAPSFAWDKADYDFDPTADNDDDDWRSSWDGRKVSL